ncbi:rod shape-determining protein MreC [Candidatus Uabimicrobium amorphum]|nr:rod shape-determining protein MreC [Candidatus Uabimicrobium amorphum]
MFYSSYFSSWSLTSFTFLLSNPEKKEVKGNKDEIISHLQKQLASKQLEIIHLQQTLANIEALQKEAFLDSSRNLISAKVLLKRDSTSHRNSFVINKGKRDGVQLGALVTFKKNLLGIVSKLSAKSSMVLHVSDPYMHIPVFLMVKKQQAFTIYDEGICVGQSKQKCKIKFIQWFAEKALPEAAVALTSGFGNRYPQGLIVGNVTIKKSTTQREKQHYLLNVNPIALDKIYNVMVTVNQDVRK